MPTSDSYHDSLIESLKDPYYAAIYLETHLEGDEYEFEPELLKLAFSHVLEALGSHLLTPEQVKCNARQIEELMEKPGKEAINGLQFWLKSLGLKLTVTVDPEISDANNQQEAVNQLEVTV